MTKGKGHPRTASHKSNPSSVPRGIVDSYCTLGHVGGGNSCGGRWSPLAGNFKRWLEDSGMGASLFAGAVMGAPSWGSRRTWGGGLRGQTSFSVVAPLGNLVGGSSTGPCEGSGDRHLSPKGPC
jgi:hypothetical protein